jgi:hypothetical protein
VTNYDEPALRRARSVDGDARGMMQIRRRLGDVLVESGLLTPQQLELALEEQRKDTGARRRLGQVVSDLGLAAERDVAKALADLLGLELIDLSRMMPAPDVVRLLPRQVAERTRVLVLDRTPTGLVVAAADPTNVLALDDVKLYTRTPELHVLVATDSQIRDQINRAWAIGHDGGDVSTMTTTTPAGCPTSRSAPRTRRSSSWSTRSSRTPCTSGPPTSTSRCSATRCGCGSASTACSATS